MLAAMQVHSEAAWSGGQCLVIGLLAVLLGIGAVHLAHAEGKPTEDNAAVRAAKRAAGATERTVNRAVKATERGAKRAAGGVERGAKATDKALTNAAKKTDNWVKDKTK
jgi:hypothetical protein